MLDMIKCSTGGAYYARGEWVPADSNAPAALAAKGFDAAAVENAKTGTMAYSILQAHNTSGDAENLKIKFDATRKLPNLTICLVNHLRNRTLQYKFSFFHQ